LIILAIPTCRFPLDSSNLLTQKEPASLHIHQ
jgi:hypothetical protein